MLKIQRYDMCDAMVGSDHRPVSAAIDVLVEEDSLKDPVPGVKEAPGLTETSRLVKIRINDIQINLFSNVNSLTDLTTLSVSSKESASDHGDARAGARGCMIYFPLQNEDPLADLRRPILMNHALNFDHNGDGALLAERNMRYIHSFAIGHSKDQVLELRSLVCYETAR